MITLFGTFLLIMFASIIIGWGAEIAAVYLSAGVALAILAWLQTSPEFAVEATIAWSQDTHLVLANLTGSLRLLMGFGWPMVFFIFWISNKIRKRQNKEYVSASEINLPANFAVEASGLVLSVLYFLVILISGNWSAADGLVLCGLYGSYFWMLNKQRKHISEEDEAENFEEMAPVVRKILKQPKKFHVPIAILIFVLGGGILAFTVHPFLDALKFVAASFGVSDFVFVQWLAPIASEFPEKVTAFNWARKSKKAPLAIVNFLSSVISQWTLMAGLVPLIYSFSIGKWSAIYFTDFQKTELCLTIAQSALSALFLADLKITAIEAFGVFILWLIQFLVPTLREEILYIYYFWIFIEGVRILLKPSKCIAWKNAWAVFKS